MRTKIFVGLCVALGASFISVRAGDTTAQAAARAALEQKLYELDHPQTQPPPGTNSVTVVAQPGESTTNVTDTVTTNAVTPQTDTAATNLVAAPAAVAPAEAAPAATTPVAAPAEATPAVVTPAEVAPVATVPAAEVSAVVAPAVTTPVVAPVVVAPAPKTSAVVTPAVVGPVAVVPVAVAPAATARSVAAPTKTKPAVAPATPKPTPALAATKLSGLPVKVKPTNEIVTVTGEIYKNAQVEKVQPDGIIISYTPAGGGLAITKVYFEDLSAELRQRYEKK